MHNLERVAEVNRAALKVFSKYGYKKTTVEDIANQLGLTKGALYQYADGKKDLYEQAVRFGLLKWQDKVFKSIQEIERVDERFLVLCQTAFTILFEDSVLKQIMVNDPSLFPTIHSKSSFKKINDDAMELVRSIFEQGVKEKVFKPMNIDAMIKILFSVYKMLVIDTYLMDEPDAMLMMESLLKALTEGFFVTSETKKD
jgi:AcrR family transcriptional regulator